MNGSKSGPLAMPPSHTPRDSLAGNAPCDTGSGEQLYEWLSSNLVHIDTGSRLARGWEEKTGVNAPQNAARRLARFTERARGGSYGKLFIGVAHDHALMQLLPLEETNRFKNAEARGYWLRADNVWLPVPGVVACPPENI